MMLNIVTINVHPILKRLKNNNLPKITKNFVLIYVFNTSIRVTWSVPSTPALLVIVQSLYSSHMTIVEVGVHNHEYLLN